MIGKQLIDFIRNNKLEHANMQSIEDETIDFILELKDKSEYIDISYTIGDLYPGAADDDDYLKYLWVSCIDSDGSKVWKDITIDEALKIRDKYGVISSSNNDVENLINFIKNNHLYNHTVIYDNDTDNRKSIKLEDIHFIKRIVIEEDISFETKRRYNVLDEETYDKVEDATSDSTINEIFGGLK